MIIVVRVIHGIMDMVIMVSMMIVIMDGSRLLIDIIDTTEVYNKQELQE